MFRFFFLVFDFLNFKRLPLLFSAPPRETAVPQRQAVTARAPRDACRVP